MVRGTEEGAPFEAVDLWSQAWRSHWRISSATLRKTLRRRRRASSVLEHVACPRRASDRKSKRLNSSHTVISYAVFCLKKKTIPTSSAFGVRFHTLIVLYS